MVHVNGVRLARIKGTSLACGMVDQGGGLDEDPYSNTMTDRATSRAKGYIKGFEATDHSHRGAPSWVMCVESIPVFCAFVM